MRRILFLVAGGCLLLSNQVALALDGAQQNTSAPAAPQIAAPPEAMLDAQVSKLGFEPNSEAGKVARKWVVQIATDPDWSKVMAPPSGQPGDSSRNGITNRFGANLSPHERETLLRLFLGVVSGLKPEQCERMFGGEGPPVGSNPLSAKQLGELLTLLNSAVKKGAHGDAPRESYSIAQALDADSTAEMRTEAELRKSRDITASEMQDIPAILKGKHACIAASAMFRSLLALPEPVRTVATWDFLSSPWHGTASQHVLQTAEHYANSEFGLDKLPTQLASRLPAAGSRPLSFRSAVVEGEWENPSHPQFDGRYRKTYWNLRNSGAVATFLSRADADKEIVWGHFQTEFGFAGLRGQEVGTGIRILPPQVFPASQFSMANESNFVPQPNSSFRIPATQPSTEDVRDYQCETYGKYPASRVFRDLTGDAVDVSCQAVSSTGASKYQIREAYLYDYSISVRLFEIDKDGLTFSRIRNVTVTQ
ncbi:hypothetical protein DSC91_006682 [Paraburkholderia caffeinilytica]|uniref:hypothetical protein n=1 Tax=Paraburkholderia caffeinilytica TaxID=1761016 RepID=UPI000E212546|nr:hypothetical protein [Paraburkholderia caffeinilytica]AXL53313.1 hypothetical protein DSC91_006682 [Paraburkholderia caffeinilytica]CAB3806257.1 hypothetical protein LMG28690_06521 [Paraburkholderia caffeinilytica]